MSEILAGIGLSLRGIVEPVAMNQSRVSPAAAWLSRRAFPLRVCSFQYSLSVSSQMARRSRLKFLIKRISDARLSALSIIEDAIRRTKLLMRFACGKNAKSQGETGCSPQALSSQSSKIWTHRDSSPAEPSPLTTTRACNGRNTRESFPEAPPETKISCSSSQELRQHRENHIVPFMETLVKNRNFKVRIPACSCANQQSVLLPSQRLIFCFSSDSRLYHFVSTVSR